MNEAERSLEYREGGPLKGKAKEAYRAGFERDGGREGGAVAQPGEGNRVVVVRDEEIDAPGGRYPSSPSRVRPRTWSCTAGAGSRRRSRLEGRYPNRRRPLETYQPQPAAAATTTMTDTPRPKISPLTRTRVEESTLKLAAGLDTTAAQEAAVAAIEAVARDAELDVVGAAVDSLNNDARAAREAARRSAEGILSGDVLESYLAGWNLRCRACRRRCRRWTARRPPNGSRSRRPTRQRRRRRGESQ